MIANIKQINENPAIFLIDKIGFGKFRDHYVWDVPLSYWQYMETSGAITSASEISRKADTAHAIFKSLPKQGETVPAPQYSAGVLDQGLRSYQAREIMKYSGQSRVIINGAIGSGKTIMALELARLYGYPKTLIVCPKTIHSSWAGKIETRTGQSVIRLSGNIENRADVLQHTNATFYLINPEVIRDERIIEAIASAGFGLAFFDESHLYLQNHSTQGYKAAKLALRFIPHYYTMTGSLVREGREAAIVDQLHLLNPALFNHVAITTVYKEHFWLDGYYKPVALKPDSERWFAGLVAANTMIITPEELKLPEPIWNTIEVDLEGDLLAAYEKAQKEALIDLADESVEIPAKIALITRLRQISGGVVMGHRYKQNNKIKEMMNIISEFAPDEKFGIACQYLDEIALVREALTKAKISFVEISGNVSGKARDENLDRFKTGDARCIILQTDTGGVGVDGLQLVSRYCIIYSGTYQSSKIDQLKGRWVRDGQTTNAVFYKLIGKLPKGQSICEIMDKAVDMKMENEKDFIRLVLSERGEK